MHVISITTFQNNVQILTALTYTHAFLPGFQSSGMWLSSMGKWLQTCWRNVSSSCSRVKGLWPSPWNLEDNIPLKCQKSHTRQSHTTSRKTRILNCTAANTSELTSIHAFTFLHIISLVHSVGQKSICLKFSKFQTGSHVTYSCHHNLSRLFSPYLRIHGVSLSSIHGWKRRVRNYQKLKSDLPLTIQSLTLSWVSCRGLQDKYCHKSEPHRVYVEWGEKGQRRKPGLSSLVSDTWEEVASSQHYIQSLIESMTWRMKSVVKAEGLWTSY